MAVLTKEEIPLRDMGEMWRSRKDRRVGVGKPYLRAASTRVSLQSSLVTLAGGYRGKCSDGWTERAPCATKPSMGIGD